MTAECRCSKGLRHKIDPFPYRTIRYGGFTKIFWGFRKKKENTMKVDKMFDVVQPKETDKIGDDGKFSNTMARTSGIAFEKDGKSRGIKLEALLVHR